VRSRRPQRPNIADMMKAFGCIDAMLSRLAQGWIHELQGAAVFLNPEDGVWYEIPEALEGWIALWERIDARYGLQLELEPMRKIVARLRYGTPIPPGLVAQAQTLVDTCKRAYRRMDLYAVGAIVKPQLIANHAEQLGLTETAP
jgi:hypothetical protein